MHQYSIPSPLNEPVPEMDRSAPECPTLWCCGADTSALRRQREKQNIEREGQTGRATEGKKAGESQLRELGSDGAEKSEGSKSGGGGGPKKSKRK